MTSSLIPFAETLAAPVFVLSPHLTRQRPIRIVHHQRAVPPCVLAIGLLQQRCIELDGAALEEVNRLGDCRCTVRPRSGCRGQWGLAAQVRALFDGKDAA